jgi:hypothetical protein
MSRFVEWSMTNYKAEICFAVDINCSDAAHVVSEVSRSVVKEGQFHA